MNRFAKIPDCIAEFALAADRATEQELTEHKEKIRRFENKVISVCAGMLAGIWIVYIFSGMVK